MAVNTKMIYAVSLFAHKDFENTHHEWWLDTSLTFSHSATYFEAVSEDEASGRANRLCKEYFPESEGWKAHSVHFVEIKFKK